MTALPPPKPMECRILPSAGRTITGLPLLGALFAAPMLSGTSPEKIAPLDRTVVAVTDFAPAGRELPVPSAQNPVYYAGVNAGYRSYSGFAIGGNKPPRDNTMLRVITKVLADQHFLPANADHPATQFIVVSWGSLGTSTNSSGPGAALAFLGGEKFDLMGERPEVPGHIGAEVFKRRWRSGEAELVLDLSGRNLYAVLIRAYDLQAAIEGRIVQLWETRLACPTTGTNLTDALPALVVSGRHVIGRETPQPLVRNAARTRDAWVEIGESEVIEYIDATEATMAEVRRTRPTPATGAK